MRYSNPQLQDKLAAAYVMGSMSQLTRQRCKRLMAQYPELSARVDIWQAKLAPLNQDITAIEPPPSVWKKIESELPKSHSRRRLRFIAFAASVLILANLIVFYQPQTQYSIDIRDQEKQLEWHIQADMRKQQLIIATHRVPKLPAGQQCVLWISATHGNSPMGAKAKLVTRLSEKPGSTRVNLDREQFDNIEQALLMVSLENQGQLPTQPTRANIVFSGGWQ